MLIYINIVGRKDIFAHMLYLSYVLNIVHTSLEIIYFVLMYRMRMQKEARIPEILQV